MDITITITIPPDKVSKVRDAIIADAGPIHRPDGSIVSLPQAKIPEYLTRLMRQQIREMVRLLDTQNVPPADIGPDPEL